MLCYMQHILHTIPSRCVCMGIMSILAAVLRVPVYLHLLCVICQQPCDVIHTQLQVAAGVWTVNGVLA